MIPSGEAGLVEEDASCGECQEKLVFIEESGELVCNKCGVVSDRPNFSTSEGSDGVAAMSKSMPNEQPTSRIMYNLNLSTVIDSENFDANGKRIQRSYELAQLRRWNVYTISRETNRGNEVQAMREIDQIVGAVGLPDSVAREACEVYHTGLKSGIIRSRSITSMAAAAVLVACNLVGANCPSEEIEKLKKTANRNIIRHYTKLLLRNMNVMVTATDPSRAVSRIAGKASLSGRVERRSLEILSRVKLDARLAGKRPASLAAAALYVASVQTGEHTNQLRLAFAAGVTPITIRKRSADISMILGSASVPTVTD